MTKTTLPTWRETGKAFLLGCAVGLAVTIVIVFVSLFR